MCKIFEYKKHKYISLEVVRFNNGHLEYTYKIVEYWKSYKYLNNKLK